VQLQAVARQLPLYELANSIPQQQQQQQQGHGEAAGSTAGVAADVEPVFVSLEGTYCLAPAGRHPIMLGCWST
jgi:hypothetical protein